MMRVQDVFVVKGRGTVATVETDGPCPVVGSVVRRVADGKTWTLFGVERFLTRLGTKGEKGEPVGLLLGNSEVATGDELVCSMPFELALRELRKHYHLRRASWRASIGWPPGAPNPLMFWPSGFVEEWRPTLADIQADDWERVS